MPASLCAPAVEAICQNTTVALQPGGNASITASDLDGGSSGYNDLSVSPSTFSCVDLGNNTVTLTASDGNGNSDQCTATVTVTDGGSLSTPWSPNDIGTVTVGNDYSFEACGSVPDQYTITGSGNNAISTTTDNVAFASQTLCGDGMITAKIESVDPNGYGGLMIRETVAAGSKQVAIFSNLTNVLRHESRAFTNAPKQVQAFYRPNPFWLRLQRQGAWVFAYYSTTGSNFQYVHAVYVPMQSCVEIGLASFTNFPNQQTDAVFSNVSISGGAALIAAGSLPDAEAQDSQLLRAELFPNPTNSQFTLRFPQVLPGEATATLRNQIGQVLEQRQLKPGDVTTEWNVSTLPSGLYFMEIRQEGLPPQVLRVVKAE